MNIAATTDQLPIEIAPADRPLTGAEFHRLADVPPEVEWFANLGCGFCRSGFDEIAKNIANCKNLQFHRAATCRASVTLPSRQEHSPNEGTIARKEADMDVRRRRDLTALYVSEVKPDAATPPKVKRPKRPKTIPKTMAATLGG